MCKFIDTIHKYVPALMKKTQETMDDGDILERIDFMAWNTLLGGDQLTVARARGAASIRAGHDSPKERLCGLVPTIEDWHCRMTLMKVKLYFLIFK